uniref:CCHC-type domain-containing protein n=1 Tax=Strongyloides papillosus TaxID=174720 RepID=A0A0N5B376_STREA
MSDWSSSVQRQEIKGVVEAVLEELQTTIGYEDLGEEVLEELTPFASLSEKKRSAAVKDSLIKTLELEKPVIVKAIEEMPDYIGKMKIAMTLQKTVEEEKILVLIRLVCDEIVMCIEKETERKPESTYKDICDFLKDRYDGQLARSTIKSRLKSFKVDPMAPKFEEQLKELAELVRKSQPNASKEAIVEAQCNRIEREVEDWDTLWNKATSQEWKSSSELKGLTGFEIKGVVEAVLEELQTTIRYEDLGEKVLEELTPFASLSEKKRAAAVKDSLIKTLGLEKPVIVKYFGDNKEKLSDVEVVLKIEKTASVIVKAIEEMPDYIGKMKMFKNVNEDIEPWLNRLRRAMTLQKIVEEEKILVLMTLVCDEIVMCIEKETERKPESTYKDICDFLKDRYDGQLARSTIKSKLKNFKVDTMAPKFEEQLKELAELERRSEVFKEEKSVEAIRNENYFGKQYDMKNKVRNVPSCFGCGEQGHKRYECSKKGKEEPSIQSKLYLDERMKLILMNRIKFDEIGENVTLPVLIKSEKKLNNNYISILALIDGEANKTSVTYNLAEAMGWKVNDLDEVKVGLAGNIEGTFKKGHQVKLMPILGKFNVGLRVCVETTRRRNERYGITLGTDFLDMKGVAVHHGQNKMTIGGRLYHGVSYNDWNRLKTMCERNKSGESMIPTRPTVLCDDVKPCVVQVPKFQFNQREIPKPAPVDKYSVKHCISTKLNISKTIDVDNRGEVSEKIKGISEDGDGISVKNDYALKRQSKKGKTRRVYYKRLGTFQEIPTSLKKKFRTRQKVKMKETVINQIKFETSQIHAITEVKPPFMRLLK